MNPFDLTGKTALVTGCNTGLGQGMAIGLAKAGAQIAGVFRNESAETERIIHRELGMHFLGIKADLSQMENLDRVMQKTLGHFGKIDILVNNAGIIRREDSIHFSEEDWDAVMDINLKATFFLSQKAAREFIKQNSGGKIINIASMLSFQGGIRVPSYTASKSGVMGITRILANEWAKHRINVNAIAPGYMETNNTEALRKNKGRNREILARIPAGRWGTPEDLQGAVVFLSSEASDYVNGFTLAVDGGWLAR